MVLGRSFKTSIIKKRNSLSWLAVRDRLLYSLLAFTRNVSMTKIPFALYKNIHFSSDYLDYRTKHAARGHFICQKQRLTPLEKLSCIELCMNGTHSRNLLH